ncbi:hypothetical protein B0T19DRAFT_493264 [Cercophora scortea]|uniref:Uncharacterized protein n=1 Tax=Cercophora scortea TaxID=314031 RepID=A0AAE0I8A2_9PEZI|nr:hypothetical protein B0T19DRAFT_493264 [Cercophora scortea]
MYFQTGAAFSLSRAAGQTERRIPERVKPRPARPRGALISKNHVGSATSSSPGKGDTPVLAAQAGDMEIKPLTDFDWTTVEPEKLRPFKPTYHITMGLRASTPSDLILIDRGYLRCIQGRQAIMVDHEATVLGAIPAGHAAVKELYSYLLGEYLPARYPSMFEIETTDKIHGTSRFINKVTGLKSPLSLVPEDPVAALKIIAQTVEDDMFLLQQQENTDTGPGEHKSIAFICCHPAGFDPSEKLGKGLKTIHTPVPAYEKIGPSMERYFSRVEAGKSVKRVNWSVQTHTRLFAPSGNHVYAGETVKELESVDIETARLRVELQTLTRLPKTRALVFSFKTYLYPLADIKAEGLGPQLADAIEGLKAGNAPDMWVYKGGGRWGRAVCELLRSGSNVD